MVASNFEGLVGYRTLRDEGQVPLKAYDYVFGRVFLASVCIATYGMSVPSLHTKSTDFVIPSGKDIMSNVANGRVIISHNLLGLLLIIPT